MRIAVVSDTHNRLPAHILPLLSGADEIWHLGDVIDPGCLAALKAIMPEDRFSVVRGNCDPNPEWPALLDLHREGFRIRLIHIPPREVPPEIDLVLHGHTHVPRNERVGTARFLNPGSVGKPNKGAPASFAWLELVRGKAPGWEIVKV